MASNAPAPRAVHLKSGRELSAALRRGVPMETEKKFGAGANKHPPTTMNTAKLDRETEELRHEHVSLDVAKLIQQGRNAKGMTQKELATKVCEKPQVIADYEAGRAIPNQMVMGKIERAIGLKLRGKDRGRPVEPPAPKKK
ncbi:unnamed protein product [Notodromas monacha]|uniref:HTH cro/C1-type domain-containing protein n=1 Tax=Notodromas monacha TaxID=399045 RepID=A0A7R9BUQ0_9CRUS|nr:unnamed protein product [Notodromas monacha]CAG0920558.1 unnamed protein product [Notodromas monacha]